MAVKNSVAAIPLTSIDSATFTGNYQLVNSGGLPQSCFVIGITNNSTKDITISYDGTTDNDFVQTMQGSNLPVQSTAQPNNYTALFPKGTRVWVKGSAGTGLVYLSGYYQPQAV